MDGLDRRILDHDPDVVPLGLCVGVDLRVTASRARFPAIPGVSWALAGRRSSVVGVEFHTRPESPITTRAVSLLAAL
jgi:hypothetical protein